MSSAFIVTTIILSIALLIFLTVKVKLHPFFALTISAFFFGLVAGHSVPEIIGAYSNGLGGTIAGIGVVIAIGTVMGALLEHSGAAETMADTILKITGKKNADIGLAVTGYFVSIPVFCDSAFVLLSPLAKRMSKDSGTSMTTMAVALAMGLHATHMLVPPTPGPLAVAGILGSNLGMVILLGMLVSIPVTVIAILAGRYFGKKFFFFPEIENAEEIAKEVGDKKLPSPLMSFLPILLPIFLMLLRTVATLESAPLGKGTFYNIADALGQTIVALFIGLIIAFFTYKSVHPDDKEVWTFDGIFGEALKTAGQIVLYYRSDIQNSYWFRNSWNDYSSFNACTFN